MNAKHHPCRVMSMRSAEIPTVHICVPAIKDSMEMDIIIAQVRVIVITAVLWTLRTREWLMIKMEVRRWCILKHINNS